MQYPAHILEALKEFSNGNTHERIIKLLLPNGLNAKLPHVRFIKYYEDNTTADFELTVLGKQVLAGLGE